MNNDNHDRMNYYGNNNEINDQNNNYPKNSEHYSGDLKVAVDQRGRFFPHQRRIIERIIQNEDRQHQQQQIQQDIFFSGDRSRNMRYDNQNQQYQPQPNYQQQQNQQNYQQVIY